MFISSLIAAFWTRCRSELCKLGSRYIKLTLAESGSNKGLDNCTQTILRQIFLKVHMKIFYYFP